MKVLLISISLTLATNCYAQDPIYCLNIDSLNFKEYDQFDSDLKANRIIMIGENHFMEANYIIQTELLMYLHSEYGIKNLLIEYGRAEAYLYNQYLKTGRREYLEKTSPGISNHDKFFHSWSKVYDYNSRLKEDDKIAVYGLDFEREPGLSFVVNELLFDYRIHPDIQVIRESLNIRLDTISVIRGTKNHMEYLRKAFDNISFTDSLNNFYIDYILKNTSYKSNLHDRDRRMLETFLEIDCCEEKYLGQFGLAHTMLNAPVAFAHLLNQKSEYNNEILVTNMYKVNSTTSPLYEMGDCTISLCGFEESTGYGRRGPWVIILKNQPSYPFPRSTK